MKSHLKVKVVSLSAEMTYIRRQEEKWKSRARLAREKATSPQYHEQNFWSLHWHRSDLKGEARSTHLAYGAMRGIPYSVMEQMAYDVGMGGCEPNWEHVQSMVERFSKDEPNSQDIMQKFSEWLTDAKAWWEENPKRIKAFNKAKPERIAALKAMKKPYTAPAA